MKISLALPGQLKGEKRPTGKEIFHRKDAKDAEELFF
jgi:hypothetical protein